VQAIPIDTNTDCPGQRPSIKAMVDFAESMDEASLETGVIFRDVSKRFYINKSMSRIGDNCRWIVSTEGGDCFFAYMERCGSRYMIQCELQTQTQSNPLNCITS
jgi:hypothetical protein